MVVERKQKAKQKAKNSVEIEAYLKPSWVLASTNKKEFISVKLIFLPYD
jgi:hypothetical protein